MESFLVAVNCITPMFLTFVFGYYTRSRDIVPYETFNGISKICFNVLLPLMMFNNVYSSDLEVAFSPRLIVFLLAETLTVYLVATIVVRKAVKDPGLQGVYIQNAFRSNVAVIGISLAQTLMDEDGVASMTMAIVVLVPMFNTLAVIALEMCRGRRADIWNTIKNIIKNPMILGAVFGAAALLLNIHIPASVQAAVRDAGKAGSVITLVALGASFRFSGLKKRLPQLIGCSFVRLILVPSCVLLCAVLLGFRKNELAVVMICTASPLATTAYPMALVYGCDYELTGDQVVLSSLLCCVSMMLFIVILKQFLLI